ncbi:hypothetical protein [Paenibacillus contaminans]|uniref:Uncharacterized protein n=1 Tax=Paenibacillus contaminans TaxID=450362 RepID=A0A329MMT8_9BACL|nr:hypothetical protein [Paenibacillus contaminans]RAV21185.1 hypothetical protein DQG23_11005 [Paenibacillus contaminans]
MILFRLAKWMEEHTQLKRSISENEGDVLLLEDQKDQVEEQLRAQANKWLEENTDPAFLAGDDISGRQAQAESFY